MSTIKHPELAIATDRDSDNAKITVTCGVEFTEFEVNAMNKLGLRYMLRCRVLNRDLWYETTSLLFNDAELPRDAGKATASEEVLFEMVAPADALREHIFTPDELLAELTLVNQEAGVEQVVRTEALTVDLAA